jgi:hypothetical protein
MKKLNGNISSIIVVILLLSCSNYNSKTSFNEYEFINNYYLKELDNDTFPRNIYFRPLDIRYFEADTIKIDGLEFLNPGNHMGDFFDYTFTWDFSRLNNCKKIDSVMYLSCPSNNMDSFKTIFGKGFIFLSKPLISENHLLIKEYKKRNMQLESNENISSYLIFEKVQNKWILKTKKPIFVTY